MAFTFFFRDLPVLEVTVQNVVPYISGRSRIRIWDAGCAMGPEPFTLAILFAERMGNFAFRNIKIIASDIDEGGNFNEIINNGVYPEDPLTRIPKDLFKNYFTPADQNGFFKIDDKILNRVEFIRHDLLSLKPIGDDFSLILCKNVLLHFQQSERIEVIKMFHKALAPEGFFVMEQTQKMPEENSRLFERVVSDAQLFRKV